MATAPAEAQGPSDGELIEAVRHGSTEAYATLYERHVAAAHNMARQVAKSQAEADDLVSEAFAKVLDALRSGRGPSTARSGERDQSSHQRGSVHTTVGHGCALRASASDHWDRRPAGVWMHDRRARGWYRDRRA